MAPKAQTMTLPASHRPSPSATPWDSGPGTPAEILPTHNNQITQSPGRVRPGDDAVKTKWYKIDFFRGMLNDIRRRAPYYVSDWTDAWDYRVVPATVYMYFAK
jgi:boron transporter